MSSHPHALSSADIALQSELLDRVHHRSHSCHYVDDYPLVFPARGDAGAFGVLSKKGDRLLAQVSFIKRWLRLGDLRLSVAVIGSVATSPEARRSGLASSTLEQVHLHLRQQGCLIAVLWSEQRTLYKRLGYVPFGQSILARVDAAPATPEPGAASLRRAGARDQSAVYALSRLRGNTLERSLEEHLFLAQLPGMTCYVLEEAGNILAFAFMGKGEDFPNIIHDFGGEYAALILLLARLSRTLEQPFGLLCPDAPHPMHALVTQSGWPSVQLPEALGYILDLPRLLHSLNTPSLNAAARDRAGALGASAEPGALMSEFAELQSGALLQRLFGHSEPAGGPRAPLPLHFWGLDCM